jgi:hypothetical protein
MENRITKRLETGEAYFEGHNGRSSSDIKGRVFGEAADRLAWIEDKIAEGNIEEVLNFYKPPRIEIDSVAKISEEKTVYTLTTPDGNFIDVLHSTEDSKNLVYVLEFADGTTVYDSNNNHLNIEFNEQLYVDYVRNIIKKSHQE